MARKADAKAAKQRQQKIILAVGGVLLVGVLALQGPKLMKSLHGSKTASEAPAATTPDTSTTSTTTPATPTTVPTAPSSSAGATTGGPSAKLAGIVIRPAQPPTPGVGQLWSLSRFKTKDPFAPLIHDKVASTAGNSGNGGTGAPGYSGSGGSTGQNGSPGAQTPQAVTPTPSTVPTVTTPAVKLGYATLLVNGVPQPLQLKQRFPKAEPTFVLVGVTETFVKIGVAGGTFTQGKAVKLVIGKPVTVVNQATGQRFVIKLVYTGAQPEDVAAAGAQPATPANAVTTYGTTTSPAPTAVKP